MNRGFTLVEVLVVASITVFITGFLVTNFSRTRVDLNQTSILVLDAIREAQNLALSGSLTHGAYRCGYGVRFEARSVRVYAGPDASTVSCGGENRDYEGGIDETLRQVVLPSSTLEIVQPTEDIFFEPPNPTTYIGNSNAIGKTETIVLKRVSATCPSGDCRSILITTAGRIQLQ